MICICSALCHLPCQPQCFVVVLTVVAAFAGSLYVVLLAAVHCTVCQAELRVPLTSSVDWKVIDLYISAGVDDLSKKIQEVKDFVDERVDALSRKQDDLAESQDEMKDQLEDVQQNISGVTHTAPASCFKSIYPALYISNLQNSSGASTDNDWKVSVPEDVATCMCVLPVETALASPAEVISSALNFIPCTINCAGG